MSVLRVAPDGALWHNALGFRQREPGQVCFYCGDVFAPDDGLLVHWMGAAGPRFPAAEAAIPGLSAAAARRLGWVGVAHDIYLHPNCFLDLVIRLMRDIHEIECSGQSRRPRRTADEGVAS